MSLPTAIVLAGGLSTRIGSDKALLGWDGQTLLERVVRRVATLSGEVLVVTSEKGKERLEGKGLGDGKVPLLVDLFPGRGSLGGIYTGLMAASSFHSLVVACDMPFLNLTLLQYMISQVDGFDVVIPRLGNTLEPLHALYSKNCLGPMKGLLEHQRLKIIDFFPEVRVRYVEEEEVDGFDPQHLSFFNVNTPADFQRAMELGAAQGREA
jgi:molybdopterin-guanine dinucleotide biosynthesis protein A